MASKGAIVGVIILIIGLILSVYAVIYPAEPVVLSTPLSVDPNGYHSSNFNMTAGQQIVLQVSISNQTIFTFDVMNRTQYYAFYGCAPFCHTGTNIVGCTCNVTSYLAAAGIPESQATLENITVTPSSTASVVFTAPVTGTYYFVFDNSIGPNYATYINTNATGFAVGSFSLLAYAVNWNFLGPGAALLIIGGIIASIFWKPGRPRQPSSKIST